MKCWTDTSLQGGRCGEIRAAIVTSTSTSTVTAVVVEHFIFSHRKMPVTLKRLICKSVNITPLCFSLPKTLKVMTEYRNTEASLKTREEKKKNLTKNLTKNALL